ncbi:MAG: hypothetical protein HY700_05040 [Gemmatimonadetes bacterium]|nr:hypothetical protein [Gemmatimonadota bacterium]
MASLFDVNARTGLKGRLAALQPDPRPRWGRFTAPQMLAHLNDALWMPLGDLPTVPKSLPIRYPPLKQLIVCLLPFPRGAPTSPELLARIGARAEATEWPLHPAFGRLSCRARGVLGYRHVDHHFGQFGI